MKYWGQLSSKRVKTLPCVYKCEEVNSMEVHSCSKIRRWRITAHLGMRPETRYTTPSLLPDDFLESTKLKSICLATLT